MANRISAIVLAAGTSSRMEGANKTLMPFAGKTVIETTVDNVLKSTANEVVVVLGFESEKVRSLLAGRPVRFVENKNYQTGMTSSIQAGVEASNADSDGYLICLSDMPLLSAADYNLIIKHLKPGEKRIVKPFFQGQGGNPVLFCSHFREAILMHQHPEGCREVVKMNKESMVHVDFDSNRILSDIDTREDYTRLAQ